MQLLFIIIHSVSALFAPSYCANGMSFARTEKMTVTTTLKSEDKSDKLLFQNYFAFVKTMKEYGLRRRNRNEGESRLNDDANDGDRGQPMAL